MRKLMAAVLVAATAVAGCARGQALEVTEGTDVTLQKKDGVTVTGRLVEVRPDQVVVETPSGEKKPVSRSEIANVRAEMNSPDAPAAAAAASPAAGEESERKPAAPKAPEYREVTIPAGTVLAVDLQTAVGSDTSSIEDPVRGTLRRAVTIDGVQALPAGTVLIGHVTDAERSGRVKGRARIAFRFTRIDPPGEAERVAIQTGVISRLAPATKKQDAAKIGGGAAGGAIIGGILGGGDGAAKGAAIGGAAGTGVVLSTRGKEVRLGPGADLAVRLQAPVKVRTKT
jgi:hypothetical protein